MILGQDLTVGADIHCAVVPTNILLHRGTTPIYPRYSTVRYTFSIYF
jgi:hypothetical protein